MAKSGILLPQHIIIIIIIILSRSIRYLKLCHDSLRPAPYFPTTHNPLFIPFKASNLPQASATQQHMKMCNALNVRWIRSDGCWRVHMKTGETYFLDCAIFVCSFVITKKLRQRCRKLRYGSLRKSADPFQVFVS